MPEHRFPRPRQGRHRGQALNMPSFRMALSTLGVLVCIVAADLSEVKVFTMLFGLAFALAFWSEIARVMRLRLHGVRLKAAVVAWAAGFAAILGRVSPGLGIHRFSADIFGDLAPFHCRPELRCMNAVSRRPGPSRKRTPVSS
jgi:hypothetical protein